MLRRGALCLPLEGILFSPAEEKFSFRPLTSGMSTILVGGTSKIQRRSGSRRKYVRAGKARYR
jgi:hypothetical protein